MASGQNSFGIPSGPLQRHFWRRQVRWVIGIYLKKYNRCVNFSFSIDIVTLNESIDTLANQNQNSITNTVFSNGYFDPWLSHGTISSYDLGENVTVINIDCKYNILIGCRMITILKFW